MKIRYFLYSLILLISSCEKDITAPINGGKPILGKSSITDVMLKSAKLSGELLDDGLSKTSARGFVITENTINPSLSDKVINVGLGTGKYEAIVDLQVNTKYIFSSFASNAHGSSYGDPVSFTSGDYSLPALTTVQPKDILYTQVLIGGEVLTDGGATVTERGFSFGTKTAPDNLGNGEKFPHDTKGLGAFVSVVVLLKENTKYYYRPYAINLKGTSYGPEASFTTLAYSVATVKTNAASNVSDSGVTLSGQITDIGGTNVTERGVCYSTNINPNTNDNKTYDPKISGNGLGSFTIDISNLKANTIYYAKAYAINSKGTSFGEQISFTTKDINLAKSITVNHKVTNGIAPVDATITYDIYWTSSSGTRKGWITKNLGATREGSAANEKNINSSGWYFQFNRKQGYQSDENTRIPNTTWNSYIQEDLNWQLSNDPCRLELGGKWRLPTMTEWSDERNTWNGEAFLSPMKIVSSAYLSSDGGRLSQWGISGNYWTSSQKSATIGFYLGGGGPSYFDRNDMKALAMPCRCISD
jgi:hypothetical protein